MTSDELLEVLRAVGESTRLRIVALLRHGELTVSDLTDILGQSQPRISRHLKLLAEAGVVDRHREGTWIYFDLVDREPIAGLVRRIVGGIDPDDAVTAADLERLVVVRDRRTASAQQYFADVAASWDEVRSLHAPEAVVEDAIHRLLADSTHRSVLDLGTGTGRMLQLLGADTDRITRAVGVDNSHSMLAVARANFDRAGLRHIDLRQGDIYRPPFGPNSFDLVVVHQVLHFLDHPGRAVREAAQLLTPGGQLLIVDYAPHQLEFLRTDHNHRRLGFADDAVAGWFAGADLDLVSTEHISHDAEGPADAVDDRLTVSIWLARDTRRPAETAGTDSPSTIAESVPA